MLGAGLLALLGPAARAAESPDASGVFESPPSAYSERLSEAPAGDALRTLYVEERAGVARHAALVRVPLFFAAGECREVQELAVIAEDRLDGGKPLPAQADDVRRGPDGGIARVHLWFETDLAAGEKRRFRLVRRTGAVPGAPAMRVTNDGDAIRIQTAAGAYEFSRSGGVRAVPGPDGGWRFDGAGLLPDVAVGVGGGGRATFDGHEPDRQVTVAAGPLFAKIRVVSTFPGGVSLEQDYRLPKDGSELVLTEALFPGGSAGQVQRNHLLAGRAATPDAVRIHRIPAGIRYALRAEHAYTVSGIGSADAALLAVPLVIGGTNGQWDVERDGRIVLLGQSGLQRGGEGEKGTLHGYWTEVRLVPAPHATGAEGWRAYRAHVQPLVAIVEESGASVEALHTALADLMREMRSIGWRQEAGRALALGENKRLAGVLAMVSPAKEGDAASLVRGAEADTAKITQNGKRRLRDDEKGRAYGRLDPYHVTYTQSAAAAVAVLDHAPATVTAVNYAMAKGVRDFGGRTDPAGFPYVDCFGRTLNMQLGPVLFGLTAGAAQGDTELVSFYRDLALSPPVQGVFGRGQRPYTGAPAGSADQTDYLYQSICDFWLRTTELLAGEDLHLHPLAYGRYTDCIDVMADRLHGAAAQDKPGATGEVRANFFRGQVHTHRWLGWSAAPFIRLLQDPAEHGEVGLTEAIRYARKMKGRWKNWPDLTFYELADILVRQGIERYQRPPRPDAPKNVAVDRGGAGVDLSWPAVANAASYRVYRTEGDGGPYVWVNSPYLPNALPALTQPRFHDAAGKPASQYVIIAVDSAGRESAWPADAD